MRLVPVRPGSNAAAARPTGRRPIPRRPVRDLAPAVHGSADSGELARLGLDPEAVLDFSANTNPYGPSSAVREAIAKVPVDRYPDRECRTLRGALAESLGVSPDQILPTNGATEAIWLVALAFIRPGDRVLVLGPTFGEYERVARLMAGRVVIRRAREENGFRLEPRAVADVLTRLRPRAVFVCNPNNPTGTVLALEVIAGWAARRPRTLFVLDEAYLPFAPGLGSALGLGRPNLLVLRSITKDLGLAGLRLGYAVGPPDLIAPLRAVQPPWSVNALAQAAGVAALGDRDHWERCREQLGRAKEALAAGLARLGRAPCPSAAHYFLLRVGDGAAFRLALLRRGVLVRDCASFGLPAHVRIATRTPEENDRLLAAAREVS